MIKDKKVKVNKQKPSDACPAQLKLIAIKCPLIQRQAALAAIPMLCAGGKFEGLKNKPPTAPIKFRRLFKNSKAPGIKNSN